jgi:hypothetical protein
VARKRVAVVAAEAELYARVRALATHDYAGARGPRGEVEMVGELGHPGALALLAVLADRRPPRGLREAGDRLADALGEIEAHQQADASGAQLVGELVGGGGAVGADHDLSLLDNPARELLELQLDDLDVVAAVLAPALPGRSTPASLSRDSSR